MRLLVIKAEMVPERKRENLDVVTLMRLLHGDARAGEYERERALKEIAAISDIYDLDAALTDLMDALPRNWGQILEMHFGRGVRTRASGKGLRKRTVENALAGICREIMNCSRGYDFQNEGLPAVRKIMSYIEQASDSGNDSSDSLLQRAVSGVKLFRNGEYGIMYGDALEEFCERTNNEPYNYAADSGTEMIISDIFVRDQVRDMQQRSKLESKVREGQSCVLIERMYEMYCIMESMKQFLPDKYEKIMAFRWTGSGERRKELFWEIAALIAASENTNLQ